MIKDLKEEIKREAEQDFYLATKVTDFIELFSKILDLSEGETIAYFNKKAQEFNIRAIIINNSNFGFIDKEQTKKVFNEVKNIIPEINFALLDNIAFLAKVSKNEIYILMNDISLFLPILSELYPKRLIDFIPKDRIDEQHIKERDYTNQYKTKQQNDHPNNSLTIEQLQSENNQLKARITELEQALEVEKQKNESMVNVEDCSIYGHSTEAIKAIFGTIKKFWINADLSQPDTIANAEDIEKWIAENYTLSNSLVIAIQKITRPIEARNLGRKS